MISPRIIYTIVAILCAGLISYAMTPVVRVLAFKIGAIDIPLDHRRMHKKPIPRIGGLAIYLGFLAATVIFCQPDSALISIWIGGGFLVFLGMLDDVYRLNAILKFFIQIGAAFIAVLNGVVVDHVSFAGNYYVFGMWRIPITILWIVGLTNAINLIDGLDGLSCGVSAICSTSLLGVVLLMGNTDAALIMALLTASCVGFLPFNRHPAKIFMGDTGALFLGYALAVMSVQGVFKVHTVLSFLVPMAIFALPLLDTTVAIIRRLLSGRSPFSPDRGHLHHKLIDMGFDQTNAVRILYAICALLGLVAIVFTDAMFDTSRIKKALLVLIFAVVLFIFNYVIIRNPSLRVHTGLFDDEPLPTVPETEEVDEDEDREDPRPSEAAQKEGQADEK